MSDFSIFQAAFKYENMLIFYTFDLTHFPKMTTSQKLSKPLVLMEI